MDNIFIPAKGPEDWKDFLAKPGHWKTGHSAKALAYCWHDADGDFPDSVRRVFENSDMEVFKNIELLLAFPEWKVPLPGGRACSQNDIFILAKGNTQLISIMVEGKVSEEFGDDTIGEWRTDASEGKKERLTFLLAKLDLKDEGLDDIRYQLLHRTASALIEAENFGAKNALMLVHSFSGANEHIEDYQQFVKLFGVEGAPDSVVFAKTLGEIHLNFAWVKGDPKYLKE